MDAAPQPERSCARTGCMLLLLLMAASALLLWSQWRARVADHP